MIIVGLPGHVPTAGHDSIVIQETTTAKVACVSGEFSAHSNVAFTRFQAIYRTNVVETTTGDEGAGRRIGTGHDPRRPQRNGVDLVGTVTVPYYQLAVL